MPGRLNKVIELFEQKRTVFGTFVPAGSIEQAVTIGESNFDFCVFEMEHSGFDFNGLRNSLQFLINRRRILEQGSLAPPVVPFTRIPPNAREHNQWVIKQALDYGVFGLVNPHLNTAEEAVHLVQAARYAQREGVPDREPEGLRGTAPGNAMRYWGATSITEYIDKADLWPLDPNGEVLWMPLVEEAEGVRNIRDIVRVRGIGSIFLGEVDLSVSLGHPMELNHPTVVEARNRVFQVCKDAGVSVGCLANPINLAERIEMGFDFLIIGPTLLEQGRRIAGRE